MIPPSSQRKTARNKDLARQSAEIVSPASGSIGDSAAEKLRGKLEPTHFQARGEMWTDARRPQLTGHLVVGAGAGLLEAEYLVHDDDLTFHPGHLGDGGDLARAVLQAGLLNDHVDRGGD